MKGEGFRDIMVEAFAGGEESEYDLRGAYGFRRPQGVYVDGRDRLYVADTGALRVAVIDLNTLESFTITAVGDLPFMAPVGVAADDAGMIYVTDSTLRIVARLTPEGKFAGLFNGDFERPTGIGINRQAGVIYVSDTAAGMVYKYDLEGNRIGSIGSRGSGPGELNHPTHVAVDRDGYVYVSDTLNFRVQVFSPSGAVVSAFGVLGDSFGEFDKIKGIAVDSEGHIYIVDSAQDMVKIYDREGRLLLFFGRKGHFYGEFSLPTGIHIDGRDRIFVADALNGRVQAFQFLGGD